MTIVKTISETLLLTAASIIPVHAANVEHGKKLYTERCGGCHDTKVHTRPNRIVHTYEDLVNRVRFCDNAAKAGLKDEEIYDVSDYLNNTFYKFMKVDG